MPRYSGVPRFADNDYRYTHSDEITFTFRLHSFAKKGTHLYAYIVDARRSTNDSKEKLRKRFVFLYAFVLQETRLPRGQDTIVAGKTAVVMPRILNTDYTVPATAPPTGPVSDWRATDKSVQPLSKSAHAPHGFLLCPYQKCSYGTCACGSLKLVATRSKILDTVSNVVNWYSSTTQVIHNFFAVVRHNLFCSA